MRPKQKIVQEAIDNGTMDKANNLVSAAYLLASESFILMDEAADLLRENGLLMGEVKKLHGEFIKSAERFFNDFKEMVDTKSRRDAYFEDLDAFDKAFRKWSKLIE